MKVLLIEPKHNYPSRTPSFLALAQGLPYIAAALQQAGHEVRGININTRYLIRHPDDEFMLEIHKAIAEFKPDLIGTGGLSAEFHSIRTIIRVCRQLAFETPLVLGGGILTSDYAYITQTLTPNFGVVGEGEETIVELAAALESNRPTDQIMGLTFLRDGKTVFSGHRKLGKIIENLAMPNYVPFDIDGFFAVSDHSSQNGARWSYYTTERPRVLAVSAARGCPFPCTFCAHPAARHYRVRSISDVMDEVMLLKEKYRCNALSMLDELFSVRPERVHEFCDRMIEDKVGLKWNCQLRINPLDKDMLAHMKEAGCQWISFGFESASQPVLDSMQKKTKVAMIERAINMTSEQGLGVNGAFIFGDPAETPETIAETIGFFNRHCRDHNVAMGRISVYPDTALFPIALKSGEFADRDEYYETVTEQDINLTSMSKELFCKLTGSAIKDAYSFTHMKNTEFEPLPMPEDLAARAQGSAKLIHYRLTGICPHCEGSAEYRVNRAIHIPDTLSLMSSLRPTQIHCPHCHKRMMVPTDGLLKVRDALGEFLRQVNEHADKQTPLVFLPLQFEQVIYVLKSYGLDFDSLNIVGFIKPNPQENTATTVAGFPYLNPDISHFFKKPNTQAVILPSDDQSTIREQLLGAGMSQENIISSDLMSLVPAAFKE